MIIDELKDTTIYNFIKDHCEDVVIFGYGGIASRIGGYYRFGLAYKMHVKIIEGLTTGTVNQCILDGIYAALQAVVKPCNIWLLTCTPPGLKKALKHQGVNKERCQMVMSCAEDKQCSLNIYYIKDAAYEMKTLLLSANKYFKVV